MTPKEKLSAIREALAVGNEARALAVIEQDAKDAGRYRWLRLRAGLDIHMDRFNRFTLPPAEAIAPDPIPFLFDNAIDAAMSPPTIEQSGS